ncbi:MAG: hypothetical protein O2899_05690, partial [Bacteroidetes bacterium]|nr:hypothetical protein [Bacteroidota bacterium]
MRSVFLSVVALWGGALLLAGCASTGPAQAPDADQALFVREVEPFSVFDSTGRPYDLPFQGGFNVPRPQFADMDN